MTLVASVVGLRGSFQPSLEIQVWYSENGHQTAHEHTPYETGKQFLIVPLIVIHLLRPRREDWTVMGE